MPVYIFTHPETGERKEIVQAMNDEHIYVDEEGVTWNREWTLPNAQVDVELDPFDGKAFAEKTKNQKGTVGDLWDQSKEMSEKRKAQLGYDPVKKKYLEKYSKDRMGRRLPKRMAGD